MAERIGIIGDGNVGKALKEGLTKAGHEVRAVGHDPDKVRETAQWAESIVLAVPFGERENAFEEMGEACHGKTVVDVTNAVGEDGYVGDVGRSGAEELQQNHDCHVVKAFNTVFAQKMAQGAAQGEPLSLLVAGDDKTSKKRVLEWGRSLGYDVVDTGPLTNARWLEALGYLNIQLGYTAGNGTDSGFRYVHPGVRKPQETVAQVR